MENYNLISAKIIADRPISFKDCGQSRNFKGFKQYREIIE